MLKVFLIILSLLTVLADLAISEEIVDSPYFIDEVKCTDQMFSNLTAPWYVKKDDVKFYLDEYKSEKCNEIFTKFGIKKYSWINKNEIEQLSNELKNSIYLEEAELFIKKSKIENHIFIVLNAKVNNKKQISVYDDLYIMKNKFYEPHQLTIINTLGFEVKNNDPYSIYDSKYGASVTGAVGKNNYQIFRKENILYGKNYETIMSGDYNNQPISINIFFSRDNEFSDKLFGRFNGNLILDTQIHPHHTTSDLSVLGDYSLLFSPYKSKYSYLNFGPKLSYDSGILFGGLYFEYFLGDKKNNYLEAKYEYSKKLTNLTSSFYSSRFHPSTFIAEGKYEFIPQYNLSGIGKFSSVSTNIEKTNPHFNYSNSESWTNNLEAGLSKDLHVKNTIHTIALTNNLLNKNLNNTKLAYGFETSDWKYNFSLTYGVAKN